MAGVTLWVWTSAARRTDRLRHPGGPGGGRGSAGNDLSPGHLEQLPPGGHVPGRFRGGGRAGGVAASARLTMIADQTAVGKPMIDRLRRRQRAPRVVPVVMALGRPPSATDAAAGWSRNWTW